MYIGTVNKIGTGGTPYSLFLCLIAAWKTTHNLSQVTKNVQKAASTVHPVPVNRTPVTWTQSIPRNPDNGSSVNGNEVHKIRYTDSPLAG